MTRREWIGIAGIAVVALLAWLLTQVGVFDNDADPNQYRDGRPVVKEFTYPRGEDQ